MQSLRFKTPAAAQSSDLLRIDDVEINVEVKSSLAATSRYISVTGWVSMDIVGDGHFTDSTGTQDNGKSISFTGLNSHNAYLSVGIYNIIIHNKLDTQQFLLNNFINAVKVVRGTLFSNNTVDFYAAGLIGTDAPIDISQFNTKTAKNFICISRLGSSITTSLEGTLTPDMISASAELFDVRTSKVKGDLGCFENCSEMKMLRLSNSRISGDILKLGNCTKLFQLYLAHLPNVTGSLESFLDAMVDSGRTSGNISVNAAQSGVTYNGELIVLDAPKTYYFSSTFERGWSDVAP